MPIQKLQDIQRAMELLSCQGPAKSIDEAAKHKYQFWDTQPVPKLSKCLLIMFDSYLIHLQCANSDIHVLVGIDTVVIGFCTKHGGNVCVITTTARRGRQKFLINYS